ncbi:hypothetical protein GCM10009546_05020 [Actinomadura livida]|uniref:Uncharacterized protein n=1 Tax=Actinomadura livida TaxID=79909 RepID=A0ABP3NLW6_9ACTN|nr:hypothetical protein GCM10010208_53830 [Actinomadura livida]
MVRAVTLGRSRAQGAHTPESDWDAHNSYVRGGQAVEVAPVRVRTLIGGRGSAEGVLHLAYAFYPGV